MVVDDGIESLQRSGVKKLRAARANHTGPVFPPAMAVSTRGVERSRSRSGHSPRYHPTMPASTPERIYLDHNATTPVFPEVVEAMRACWSEPYLNPASQHEFGRRARRTLEDARERIAELLGATARDRLLFTSGGTESNNLAIRGRLWSPYVEHKAMQNLAQALPNRLAISAIEHPSIT